MQPATLRQQASRASSPLPRRGVVPWPFHDQRIAHRGEIRAGNAGSGHKAELARPDASAQSCSASAWIARRPNGIAVSPETGSWCGTAAHRDLRGGAVRKARSYCDFTECGSTPEVYLSGRFLHLLARCRTSCGTQVRKARRARAAG